MLSLRGLAYGSAAMLLALACAATLVGACASASSASGFNSLSDGGSFDGGGPDGFIGPDSSSGEAGSEAGTNLPTTALFVQGSPSLPDVRLCWGTAAWVADVAPFPGD